MGRYIALSGILPSGRRFAGKTLVGSRSLGRLDLASRAFRLSHVGAGQIVRQLTGSFGRCLGHMIVQNCRASIHDPPSAKASLANPAGPRLTITAAAINKRRIDPPAWLRS
jgi:hypothetical protein